MAEQDTPETPPPARRRRRGRLGVWMAIAPAAILAALAIAYLSLTGRPVVLPDWAASRIESALDARAGPLRVDLGSVVLQVNRRGNTRVVLRNLVLSGPDGASLGQFNTVSAGLAPGALFEGAVRPTSLSISGAQLTVRRAADGAFSVRLGSGREAMGDLPGLLDRIDTAFASEAFARIGRITASDLTLTLEDARSGRLWQVTGGEIDLKNNAESIEINVIAELFDGTELLPRLQLSFNSQKGSRAATLTARVEDFPARDIAVQSPALSFLGALDARVSGALRTVIAGDGTVETLDGTLDIADGALRPADSAVPVSFNSGRAYFSYDPVQQEIEFSEVSVESDAIRVSGRGHAYLRDFSGAWPGTLLSQLSFDTIELAPEGVFAEAVAFDRLIADYRLRLDPFAVDFGQVVLLKDDMRVEGRGTVKVGAEGWEGAFDLSSPALTPDRLLALWPLDLGPMTRRWLDANLKAGRLLDVEAGVRLQPGQARPRFGFTFDYKDAEVRFLPEMPTVTGGRGHASLFNSSFAISIAEGTVAAPGGGMVKVDELSSFQIDDVFAKPGVATLRLKTTSRLRDILLVMENPPFRVLTKANRSPDMLEAKADLSVEAHFPLEKDIPVENVAFEVTGTLTDAVSDTIIDDHTLSSESLDLRIVPGRLTLSGPVRLDDLPLDVTLRQPLDRDAEEPGRIDGTVELSQLFLDTLGIGLPDDMVAGQGSGRLSLTLNDGRPPDFSLRSDLAGLNLSLPGIGWRKPPAETGALEIDGRLGPVPEVERLAISGNGLDAEGALSFGAGGAFEAADFSRVTVGGWLDAPVRIEARAGEPTPRIVLPSGSVNLDRQPDTGPGAGERVPVSLNLDTLRISEGLALSPFRAEFTSGAGLDGTFEARVNGGEPISGTLVPQRGRTAIRIRGADAGQAFRDAGVFRSLDEGSLDLILTPREGAEGFDGMIEIKDALLGDQPVLVDMLDAVSVVGLIDQLRGPGIHFTEIQGRFRLTDDRLTLTQGSAVGASLGVSLDGVYDIAGKRLAMQGVLSPIYLLNSVGQVFTRRGEGLFGFTFQLTGSADDPRVSVDPLSIFTPGNVRDIFRRPRPE